MSCSEKYQFQDKVVLITGSSSGIGAGAALEFARQGASVSITGRREEKLQEVARQCQEVSLFNIKPAVTVGDVTNLEDNRKLVENTLQVFGKLDILVNNAGIFKNAGKFEDVTLEDYDSIIDTNMRSVFALTQLCVPHLAKTKGNIVNVSSNCSTITAGIVPYSISKASLDHFTRCLAGELAPQGIRVNCVNPGPVKTDVLRWLSKEEADAAFEKMKTPLGRVGEPQDIANAIAFLASDKASLITGVCMLVDGGTVFKTSWTRLD